MDFIHTSPNEISTIDPNGLFGSFLFFVYGDDASDGYSMSVGDVITYRVTLNDDDVINARELFYHENAGALDELVAEFDSKYDIGDIEMSKDLISGRVSGWDEVEGWDGDADWDAQYYAAKAAKILGFRGVCVEDEQGESYMIDMLGREDELRRV